MGDDGLVLARVELDVEHVRRLALSHAAGDADRLARSQLAVHGRGGNSDALLAAGLDKAVKLRSVQQLAEELRDCALTMPGPLSCTTTRKRPSPFVSSGSFFAASRARSCTSMVSSGRMPASSQASRELSTASLMVVRMAL